MPVHSSWFNRIEIYTSIIPRERVLLANLERKEDLAPGLGSFQVPVTSTRRPSIDNPIGNGQPFSRSVGEVRSLARPQAVSSPISK